MDSENIRFLADDEMVSSLNMAEQLIKEINKEIVGQPFLMESLLLSLLSDGHLLIEGVPGLAKTKTIKSLALAVGGSWSRVQFTPDLLPSDLTGQRVFNLADSSFSTELGPIMCNFLLADEINRAPAKVQSALLECMEERQVTINNETFEIPKPFLVLATMNPYDADGTYNLPVAQMDRFLLRVRLDYPDFDDEVEIVRRSLVKTDSLSKVLSLKSVMRMQKMRTHIYVPKSVARYAVEVVRATRDLGSLGLGQYSEFVVSGAGVRASLFLITAAQSKALISGRRTIELSDIKSVADSVITHRLVMSYKAEMEGIKPDDIVAMILKSMSDG